MVVTSHGRDHPVWRKEHNFGVHRRSIAIVIKVKCW